MLRNIEFINTPRQVGKTTKLVRMYKEHLELGRQVYLLTFSERVRKDFTHYLREGY